MSNVVDLYPESKRINAKACLQGRVDELLEDDDFTDVLVLTFGEDGLAIRTNAGGVAECVLMLEMFKDTLIKMHMYDEEDDEYEYE